MSLPAPAVEDADWLEPDELYLTTGESCEVDRPLFQGDVFTGVPLPSLPRKMPEQGKVEIDFADSMAMLLPHPCQCYNGDSLRPQLTVAPVTEVLNYDNFGEDHSRAYDKFALPDLPVTRDGDEALISHVASFGRLTTVPRDYLDPGRRIACLSHKGLGLLAKRLIRFQLRMPSQLGQVMVFTQSQWNEAFLMQAWIRKHRTLKGFSAWMKTPCIVPQLNASQDVIPIDYLLGALEALIETIENLET
jgi:hypothetical protein